MRASNYHINTLKEAPSEAEVASHQLMTRAGMIRKLAGDLTAAAVEISDAEIRAVLNDKTAEARRQFMDSLDGSQG